MVAAHRGQSCTSFANLCNCNFIRYSFTIENTKGYSAYVREGIVTQVKVGLNAVMCSQIPDYIEYKGLG